MTQPLNLSDRELFVRQFFGEVPLPNLVGLRPSGRANDSPRNREPNVLPDRLPGDMVTCADCGEDYVLSAASFEDCPNRLERTIRDSLQCPNCVSNLFSLFTGSRAA